MSYPVNSGGPDTNILQTDLVADANHTHDFAAFGQTWNDVGTFDVNATNGNIEFNVSNAVLPGAYSDLSMGVSSFIAGATSGTPNAVLGELRLDGNVARLQGSVGLGNAYFMIDNSGEAGTLGEAQVFIGSNAVVAAIAAPGQVLTLMDETTGECEFQDPVGCYRHNFVAADWVGPVGGYMTLSIPAATHGKGTNACTVQAWEDNGVVRTLVGLDQVTITGSTGDVELRVVDGQEFDGFACIC